jgi:hypothetical protein
MRELVKIKEERITLQDGDNFMSQAEVYEMTGFKGV